MTQDPNPAAEGEPEIVQKMRHELRHQGDSLDKFTVLHLSYTDGGAVLRYIDRLKKASETKPVPRCPNCELELMDGWCAQCGDSTGGEPVKASEPGERRADEPLFFKWFRERIQEGAPFQVTEVAGSTQQETILAHLDRLIDRAPSPPAKGGMAEPAEAEPSCFSCKRTLVRAPARDDEPPTIGSETPPRRYYPCGCKAEPAKEPGDLPISIRALLQRLDSEQISDRQRFGLEGSISLNSQERASLHTFLRAASNYYRLNEGKGPSELIRERLCDLLQVPYESPVTTPELLDQAINGLRAARDRSRNDAYADGWEEAIVAYDKRHGQISEDHQRLTTEVQGLKAELAEVRERDAGATYAMKLCADHARDLTQENARLTAELAEAKREVAEERAGRLDLRAQVDAVWAAPAKEPAEKPHEPATGGRCSWGELVNDSRVCARCGAEWPPSQPVEPFPCQGTGHKPAEERQSGQSGGRMTHEEIARLRKLGTAWVMNGLARGEQEELARGVARLCDAAERDLGRHEAGLRAAKTEE